MADKEQSFGKDHFDTHLKLKMKEFVTLLSSSIAPTIKAQNMRAELEQLRKEKIKPLWPSYLYMQPYH